MKSVAPRPRGFAHSCWRLSGYGFGGALLLGVLVSGCMTAYKGSVGATTEEVFTRIYLTDFNTAWQAVLDALKSTRMDVTNRESGFIQTRWTDNTADKNLDSFGTDALLKAQYRFKISVAKGFYDGRNSIKISVQKEQLVQRDVLEGWRPVEADSIEENTLLYRIGRLIYIRMRMAYLEEQKLKNSMKDMKFDESPQSEAAPPSSPEAPQNLE